MFEPIKLVIKTEDEARVLWARLDLNTGAFVKAYHNCGVCAEGYEEHGADYPLWERLHNMLFGCDTLSDTEARDWFTGEKSSEEITVCRLHRVRQEAREHCRNDR